MIKKLSLLIAVCVMSLGAAFAQTIDKIEPLFWWTGMKNPELQLMVYGENIANYRPSISYEGVVMKSCVTLESPNYMLLYLDISKAQPGTFDIVFQDGKKKFTYPYELKQRKDSTDDIQGYDSSDVLYLVMPDRFANGDPSNDQIEMGAEYQVDRSKFMARHGGDLKGIEDHLDYFVYLGVTAIWLNPVLENDARGGSYHGYFSTNMYQVDRRLGGNEDYCRLIQKAHDKGLRVVMDIIFNHIGGNHPWVLDPPAKDWINESPSRRGNHQKSVFYDNYASKYDSDVMKYSGFQVDINQANPHISKYLIQNTIWWIEYARIDAIRQDTYPYADYDMMRQWNLDVMAEYPQFNIVGEVWTEHAIGTSWWQKDSPLNKNNTYLKSVMDFALMGIASDVFNDKSENGSLGRIYDHLGYDFVYADIKNLLRFLENHDTSRFLRTAPENLDAFKQGTAFLLTITGTPQVYYGYELLMNGSTSSPGGDGNVRLDVPGGWPGDTQNWFTAEGRSEMQNEAWNYMSALLHWRQDNKVISDGEMKHFVPQNGVYVYERYLGDKNVMVFINGANKEVTINLDRYAESIKGQSYGVDVVTKRNVQMGKELKMAPKEVLVLDMKK